MDPDEQFCPEISAIRKNEIPNLKQAAIRIMDMYAPGEFNCIDAMIIN